MCRQLQPGASPSAAASWRLQCFKTLLFFLLGLRCFFCARVSVSQCGAPLSHALLPQAIDVWSVGCVLAELCVSSAAPAVIICNTLLRYQLFKSDNRSFRPFFYGTIKLGPGEREGEPLPAALCSRIVVQLFCDADSQCAQAELLLKTIFSIIGDVTLQVRVLDVNVTFALYQARRLL